MNDDERNTAIAQKVMRWTRDGNEWVECDEHGVSCRAIVARWKPTSNWEHASMVLAEMQRRGYRVDVIALPDGTYSAHAWETAEFHGTISARGVSSGPRAICEVALVAAQNKLRRSKQ